jgi:hypothetical protein
MIKFKKIDHDRDPIMIPNTRKNQLQGQILQRKKLMTHKAFFVPISSVKIVLSSCGLKQGLSVKTEGKKINRTNQNYYGICR